MSTCPETLWKTEINGSGLTDLVDKMFKSAQCSGCVMDTVFCIQPDSQEKL